MNCIILRRVLVTAAFLFATTALVAEQAELKVEVKPKEAFVFVDGKPIGHHAKKLELAPGEHTIGVYNYGFVPQIKTVTLKTGDNPELEVRLEPTGGPVQGPWGRLDIKEGHNRDALFLNGKTTDFYIGHLDETTSHLFMKQKMILPPGTHQLTIVDPRDNKEVFSSPVEIVANRKTIFNAETGAMTFEPWEEGAEIHSLPRFSSDATETIVAVAPVKGSLATIPAEINCGQPARLIWNVNDAVYTSITANGVLLDSVPVSGEQTVSPKETTTYVIRTVGPGGIFTAKQTLRVNNTVQTALTAAPAELHYRQLDGEVKEQETSTLRWSASNADSVRIEPIGAVSGTSGEATVSGVPSNTELGPVAEMKTYKIEATNACGGSDTSTASVHITGAIEKTPPPAELPASGSPLPLIGLLGLGSLASSMVVRRFRKDR